MLSVLHIKLNELITDYFKCDDLIIKEKILNEIRLITETLYLNDFSNHLLSVHQQEFDQDVQ